MSKRLYKSRNDRVFAGVCGGVANFFGIDSTIVRLGWVAFCFLGGSGIVGYIVAAIIIPTDSNWTGANQDEQNDNQTDSQKYGGWK